MTIATGDDRWLIAIDIDGTLVHDDGFLAQRTIDEVARVRALGHEVIVATGRSSANAFPVIKDINITTGFAVCSNGAVTIELHESHERGFRTHEVISFDPKPVLSELIAALPNAHFAVEDIDGTHRFHRDFPAHSLGDKNIEVPLDELTAHPVSRIVVLSPDHDSDQFSLMIDRLGLHSVTYAIGYTAWLDIAPLGVSKASALETRRLELGIKPSQIISIGDGRNDLQMFEWSRSLGGYAFAMGQSPEVVKEAATAVTATVEEDGVAQVLSGFEGILFTAG